MRGLNPEIAGIRRLAEGAVLVAAVTAMAFQYLRMELFETEKNAILMIVGMLILGTTLVEFVRQRRIPRLSNPLVLAVLAMVFAGLASTIFSFSPSYSFWGSPTRAQGLVMLIIYALLFWQAMRSGTRLSEGLFPVLVMTSVPMCVWAIQAYLAQDSGVFRPASTAGNPNFLAGWLTMFLLFFISQVYHRIRTWERPFTPYQWLQMLFFAGIFVLNLGTFILMSSRGAFAGFAAGFGVGIFVLLSYYKLRIPLIVATIATIIGIVGYLVIVEQYRADNVDENEVGFLRIFVPYDQSRDVLWQSAVKLVEQSTNPFVGEGNNEDDWAFLRPAVGYGLETLEQTQARFGEPFDSSPWGNRFVERFHNIIWDWIAEAGTLGLLAIIAVYQTAIYIAMRHLRFLKGEHIWLWLASQIISVPLGVWFASTILPQPANTLIPLGGAVGVVIANLLWIIRSGLIEKQDEEVERSSYKDLTIMAILCVVFAQWIDNQFGFMQIMSQTLFFILLGYLVALTASPEDVEIYTDEEQPEPVPESRYWYGGTLIAGLFLTYSMGQAFDSNFTEAAIAKNQLHWFLLVLFIVGGFAYLLAYIPEQLTPSEEPPTTRGKRGRRKKAQQEQQSFQNILVAAGIALIVIPIVWGVFFGLRQTLVATASENLNNALLNNTGPSAEGVEGVYRLLSTNGILLMLIGLGVFYFIAKGRQSFSLFGISSLVVAGFLIGGFILYSQNFTVATMRNTAQGFVNNVPDIQPLIASDEIYKEAIKTAPNDIKLRLNHIDALMRQTQYFVDPQLIQRYADQPAIIQFLTDPNNLQSLLTRIQEAQQEAIDTAPFFVNSKTYEVFISRFSQFARQFGLSIGTDQPPNFPQQPPTDQQSGPPPIQSFPPGVEPNDLPPPIRATMEAQQATQQAGGEGPPVPGN